MKRKKNIYVKLYPFIQKKALKIIIKLLKNYWILKMIIIINY